jgi:hypothetical protein
MKNFMVQESMVVKQGREIGEKACVWGGGHVSVWKAWAVILNTVIWATDVAQW